MNEENWSIALPETRYEVTRKDEFKDIALKHSAWASPLLLSAVPAVIFLVLFVLFGATPPIAATIFFFGVIAAIIGFVLGLGIAAGSLFYRSRWLGNLRERIAVDGIRTEEVKWFMHELTSSEKKSLKAMESQNRLLGDAYRETLASRLTATRIVKSSKRELLLVSRREGKLKNLKTEAAADLLKVLGEDREKLTSIREEAEQMRMEAETRLQMIEAANSRGTSFVDTENALKKLSARSSDLPLALEALKMEDEIRKEIEAGDFDPKPIIR
jgi:hypothetical protein